MKQFAVFGLLLVALTAGCRTGESRESKATALAEHQGPVAYLAIGGVT